MICSKPEDRKFFKKFSLNYVVYDEGHMLRSCNTQRYQNLMKVRSARKILVRNLLIVVFKYFFVIICNEIFILAYGNSFAEQPYRIDLAIVFYMPKNVHRVC